MRQSWYHRRGVVTRLVRATRTSVFTGDMLDEPAYDEQRYPPAREFRAVGV
jgi:hypothetical protein